MKKLLLLFTIALLCGKAPAQNEYLQHNPEWTVMEVWSASYPCVAYDTVTFYLNGDTVINSLTYKQLYARGTCRNTWWSNNPNMNCNNITPYNYPYSGYQGAIRSAGTQILYMQNNTAQEYLLFDYDLQQGSHLHYAPSTTADSSITVAFIDSVYTPYGYLKKFHFSTDTSRFIMEGGLSSYGLYHYCDVMFDFSSWSMCYTLNDTAWWPVQGPNCDAILLDAPIMDAPSVSLQLVPNPASDYVRVNLFGEVLKTIVVYTIFGEAVKTQTDAELFVGDLAPGIYFVKVQTSGPVLTERIIIER